MDRGRSASSRSVSVSRRAANALEASDHTKAREIAQATQGDVGETLRNVLASETTEVKIAGDQLQGDDVAKGRILAALFILLQTNETVRVLTVEKVDITQPWLMKIIAATLTKNTTIRSFRLEDTNIGPEGANMLATSLSQNQFINMLSLKGNSIGDSGTTSLTEALLNNTTIHQLNLEDNVLSDAGLSQLSRLLEDRTAITRLYIGKNMFTFDKNKHVDPVVNKMITATETFSRALLKNKSLNLLSLSGNQMKLSYTLAPVLDALKFCPNVRILDLSECPISNRLIFSLAEYCIAVKGEKQKLNLTGSGVEGRYVREACAFRIAKHHTSVIGVDYSGISNSEEIIAQIAFIVHLLDRQDEEVFPNSKEEEFILLDGRVVTIHVDDEGCILDGEILYSHGDSLTFTPPDVTSKRLQEEEAHNKSFSSKVNRVQLHGCYKMLVPAGCSIPKMIAVGSAVVNLIDYFLDLVVLGQLAAAGQWETFLFLLAVVALAVIYVSYSLCADGRIMASVLHPFSLSIVLDAFNFVVRGQVPSATIMIDTSQPMQGLASIQRLKLMEALLEAAPQVLLQSFVALDSEDPGVILLSSIGISFLSIVGAITQSDRQKIGAWGNAVDKPWVSTLSFSIVFLAAFRSMEVLSNIATISLAMEALPLDENGSFNIAAFLGITLGSKLLLTVVRARVRRCPHPPCLIKSDCCRGIGVVTWLIWGRLYPVFSSLPELKGLLMTGSKIPGGCRYGIILQFKLGSILEFWLQWRLSGVVRRGMRWLRFTQLLLVSEYLK
eukprot:gb/GECG01015127.1/.p1 GENE.gb/GECG01015127.1/~~gb/GECG01015127.1/.p1  ORF type:complete len:781 (+),score=70.91 gb/GECG01015127.1/:1-2343(+)